VPASPAHKPEADAHLPRSTPTSPHKGHRSFKSAPILLLIAHIRPCASSLLLPSLPLALLTIAPSALHLPLSLLREGRRFFCLLDACRHAHTGTHTHSTTPVHTSARAPSPRPCPRPCLRRLLPEHTGAHIHAHKRTLASAHASTLQCLYLGLRMPPLPRPLPAHAAP